MGIRYTHSLDLFHKVALMIVGVAVVTTVTDIIEPVASPLERLLVDNELGLFWFFLTICYAIGGYIASIMLLSKTFLPPWLPSYARVRYLLATDISTNDAQKVSFLFDGSLGGTWYPLWSLRKIDKNYRREALLRLANHIASKHGLYLPFLLTDNFASQQPISQNIPNSNLKLQTQNKDSITASSLRVLGINGQQSDFATIRLAYRRKVAQFHPDKFVNEHIDVIRYAEETTKELNAAYAHLERIFK